MNRIRTSCLLLSRAAIGMALLMASLGAVAEESGGNNYAVTWFSVDAGSGTSAGGSYTVQGSLGQADVDPLHPASTGAYELVSGFWSVPPTIPADALFADGFELK